MSASDRKEEARILVVDDDDSIREMLTQFLIDEGFDAVGAENGLHAFSIAMAMRPDVVVLDLGLPVLDGSGFAREWRQQEFARDVPIVAISGQPFGEAMAREIGAVIFYDKPLDLTRLSRSVRELANAHRASRLRKT